MSVRNIGGMAESKLEEWAHQVGITPNKVQHDREGWDYFLQFPVERDSAIPTLDRQRTRIECIVQVKGTDSEKSRISISLSNWNSLVQTPLPAFFLVICYRSQNTPVAAYLIHIGKRWIDKVLQRLRKLHSNEAGNLHKKTLDLVWKDGNQLGSLDGEGLREAIYSYVGTDMASYDEEKKRFREEAGDPIPARIHLNTADFESDEQFWNTLVDFAIGEQDELSISNARIEEDIRFGIPATSQAAREGLLSLARRPIVNCSVLFESNGLISSLHGELIAPNWFFPDTEIPKRFYKQRVVFEIGDATIRPYDGDAKVNLRFDQAIESRRSIAQHANLWRLVLIIGDRAGFSLRIESSDGLVLGTGKSDYPLVLEGQDALKETAIAAENAYFLARRFDFPTTDEVNLEQIWMQRETLTFLRNLCDVNTPIHSLHVDVDAKIQLRDRVTIPYVRHIVFEDQVLLIAVAIEGKAIAGNIDKTGLCNVTVEAPRRFREDSRTFARSKFTQDALDNFLDRFIEVLENRGTDVIVVEETA